jgi:hypothetical protein
MGPVVVGVTLFGVFAVVLSHNVIPFARYALPLMVMCGFLGAAGMVYASRAAQRVLGRGVAGVLTLLAALGVMVAQYRSCGEMARRIEEDSRYKVANFIASLPARTTVLADSYVGLYPPTGDLREAMGRRVQVFVRFFVADLYHNGRAPASYIAICDCNYDRFMDPESEAIPGDEARFEQRKRAYEELLSKPAVWEYKSERPTRAFADPQIRVVKLR